MSSLRSSNSGQYAFEPNLYNPDISKQNPKLKKLDIYLSLQFGVHMKMSPKSKPDPRVPKGSNNLHWNKKISSSATSYIDVSI